MSSPTTNVSAFAGEGLSKPSAPVHDRFCPSCGRSIAWEAPSCPYCQWSQGEASRLVAHHDPIPAGRRTFTYLGSALVPLFGIVVGAIYMGRADEEHKHVGTVCLVLGALNAFLMPTVLSALLYVMVLGWGS